MVVHTRGSAPDGPRGSRTGSVPDSGRQGRFRLRWPTVELATLRRATRRRPALSVAFAAVALGGIVASVFGLTPEPAEFHPPPVAARPDSATPDTTGPDTTGPDSAGPDSAGPDTARPAGPRMTPVPTRTGLPGAERRAVAGPAYPGVPDGSVVISFGRPRDGEAVTAATAVSGDAVAPGDHQVWLSWRRPGGTHHIVGACPGEPTFICEPVGLESGGGDTFVLTAIVVGPATARELRAGETRDTLPADVARSEITVRRAVG